MVDNIWNKLTWKVTMIRSDALIGDERYKIWYTLEYETNEMYKERTLQVFGIDSNPSKSMRYRPVLSESVEN